MNPHSRAAWALGISLIVWSPVAFSVLIGAIDLPLGGMYYLGALAISWIGTGVIMNLTATYRNTVHNVERAKREIEEIERRAQAEREHHDAQQRRRHDDTHD